MLLPINPVDYDAGQTTSSSAKKYLLAGCSSFLAWGARCSLTFLLESALRPGSVPYHRSLSTDIHSELSEPLGRYLDYNMYFEVWT